MIAAALLACGPATPEAWDGIEQAVVVGRDAVVVDRVRARRNDDDTVIRVVDRCLWRGDHEARCVVGPDTRSTLSGQGGLLLDERVDHEHHRSLVVLDPEWLTPTATLPLGLEPDGRVAGGASFVDGGGIVVFVNHGLAGVEVTEREGRASFTVERWDGGALTWRRGLLRWPQEAVRRDGRLAVLDRGRWSWFDLATGDVHAAPGDGGPGACLLDDALLYVSSDEPPSLVSAPLDGASGTWSAWTGPRPFACVARPDGAWFHGSDGEGGGFLVAPDGRRDAVTRVDLELARHVDADGSWWFVELGRGFVVWDPQRREPRGPSRELHDVVRLGDDLAAYGVGVDLTLWIWTRAGEWRRPHRLSPRSFHVDPDGHLWTFAHRTTPGEVVIEVLDVPSLRPISSRDTWPSP